MYEYYKKFLNSRAQELYDVLLNNIAQYAAFGYIRIKAPLLDSAMKDAGDAYQALQWDRPEFYFLEHRIQIRVYSDGYVTIQQQLKYNKTQIHRINRLLRIKRNRFLEGVMDKSLVLREYMIYCKIGREFQYSDGPFSHDLVGLLVYREGVCESLSGMLVIALREAGIPAVVVHGFAGGQAHRWCKVWINRAEYYLDVTWDMINCKRGWTLHYFNLTYEQMGRDHCLIEDMNDFIKIK